MTNETDTDPNSDDHDAEEYGKFDKLERAEYDRVNDFLREHTYITAREWAVARVSADFRTPTGYPTTKIGEELPDLVGFVDEEYSPQAVYSARSSFEEKVRKSAATFLYGAMSGFLSSEELDDILYEATEVSRMLLETEGSRVDSEQERDVEERVSEAMQEVRAASEARAAESGSDSESGQ